MRRSSTHFFLKSFGLLGFGLAFAAMPLLVACSDESPISAGVEAGADADAGRGAGDGGVVDEDVPMDASISPSAPPGTSDLWLGAGRGMEDDSSLFGDATSCFDGVDNDSAENGAVEDGVDCDDSGCQSLPSCCANEPACVGDQAPIVSENFEACGDAVCGHDFTIFGGPAEPVIDSGSLALQGDSDFDTGLYGNEALDLRDQRIDLSITFRLGECGGCVETAAVALTTQESLGENTFVRPLVGLRALSTVNEVQLIVHDRVVETYSVDDLAQSWDLSVMPSGELVLTHGSEVLARKEFVPAQAAHLVLYGHSTNPGVEHVGARIEELTVGRYTTDRVDAWTRTRSLEQPGGRVSAVRVAGVDYLAINDSLPGPDNVRFRLASDGSVLNWVFQSDWGAEDYSVALIEGRIYVYAVDAEGNLIRGAVDLDLSEVGEPEVRFSPSVFDWASIGNPSVIEANTIRILVAEVDGALAAAFNAGTGWVSLDSLPSLTRGAREPSLVTHDDVYWLHYSVQSGTRQRVRAMVSDQMFHWRDLGDALSGSGEVGSVDRFSVGSPALVSDGDSLRMYLNADDHVIRRVGVVERLSPVGRMRR